jgi:hypothetical protein
VGISNMKKFPHKVIFPCEARIEKIAKRELNILLQQFYAGMKSKKGEE